MRCAASSFPRWPILSPKSEAIVELLDRPLNLLARLLNVRSREHVSRR